MLKTAEPLLFGDGLHPPEHLIKPSGSLSARIAHHLRNPTFAIHDLSVQRIADTTNPYINMLLQSGFNTTNSLFFDHIARRDNVDGFKSYPQSVLTCHERFLEEIRSSMKAEVEIVYGEAIRERMLDTQNFEALPLWGKYKEVPVYLEWQSTEIEDHTAPIKLRRFILFAHHPAAFLLPWGSQEIWTSSRSSYGSCSCIRSSPV